MEYVNGINIDNTTLLKKNNYNLKEVSSLLANCFSQQIFKHGIVHADPHSGNVFITKLKKDGKETNKLQLILLDHGLYKYLKKSLRLSYSYLWKGIITQNEEMVKKAVKEIGIDNVYYRLFAGMVTAQNWDTLMDPEEKDLKARLEVSGGEDMTRIKGKIWMKQIAYCLQKMDQDLLLVFKVNDYLRCIDGRLGRPFNTFYYTVY